MIRILPMLNMHSTLLGLKTRSRRVSLSSSLKSVDLTEKLIIYCCRRLDDKNFCRNRKFNDLDL